MCKVLLFLNVKRLIQENHMQDDKYESVFNCFNIKRNNHLINIRITFNSSQAETASVSNR